MVKSVRCPRCQGTGTTTVTTYSSLGRAGRVETSCPLCRGTGQASLLEKMGTPPGRPWGQP